MNHNDFLIFTGFLIIFSGCMGINQSSVPREVVDDCTLQLEILSDPGGRVSWHHDGNMIAFDRMGTDGYLDIYTVYPDGTGLTCLTDDNPQLRLHNGNPSWHPSGNFLVFQAQDPDLHLDTAPYVEKFVSSPGMGIHNNLWIMNSTGSQFWKVTHVESNRGVLHPHFSPDGTRLLWTEIINLELDGIGYWTIMLADFVMDEDGPSLENIQTFRPHNLQLYEVHGFSPHGESILFSGIAAGGFFYDMEIYFMDLTTHTVHQLTTNDEWDEHAHFTADGSHIVWVSSEDVPQPKGTTLEDIIQHPPKLEYWIMNTDGTQKKRLSYFNDPSSPGYMDVRGGVGLGDFDISPLDFTLVAKMREGREKELTLIIVFSGGCSV